MPNGKKHQSRHCGCSSINHTVLLLLLLLFLCMPYALLLPQQITISFVQSRKSAHTAIEIQIQSSQVQEGGEEREKIHHQLQQHIQSSSLPILTCSCILPLPIDFNGGCHSFRQSSHSVQTKKVSAEERTQPLKRRLYYYASILNTIDLYVFMDIIISYQELLSLAANIYSSPVRRPSKDNG